jgi:hypothetical protein
MISMNEWLDACEANLVHPAVVRDTLRRQGWDERNVNATVAAYRRRFNEHPVGYSLLLFSTGLSALAIGSLGHTLADGIGGSVDRYSAAFWLTAVLCLLPVAAWSHSWAARVDREDPVAIWSGTRRTLTRILIGACAVVGGARVFYYALQLISYMLGAQWFSSGQLSRGTINVAIALGVTVPLGAWAYRFLHRFDGEDPERVPAQRRRPTAARARGYGKV